MMSLCRWHSSYKIKSGYLNLNVNISSFVTGIVTGLVVAIIGGFIDYRLNLKNEVASSEKRPLPGCMMYVAGFLGVAGIVAVIVSWIATGGIVPALVMGLGVLTGFYIGFLGLFALWWLVGK